jgi:cell division protein FtsL
MMEAASMSKQRLYTLVGAAIGTLSLGLALVWVNIELVDLSYSIKELHKSVQEEKELQAKLEVEAMNLSSSYRLQEKAAEMNLRPPESSEIRSLD